MHLQKNKSKHFRALAMLLFLYPIVALPSVMSLGAMGSKHVPLYVKGFFWFSLLYPVTLLISYTLHRVAVKKEMQQVFVALPYAHLIITVVCFALWAHNS